VRTLRPALALALLVAAPAARPEPALERWPRVDPASPECGLLVPGSESATIADCTRCHTGSGSGHPVGLDYAREGGAPRGHGIPLRTASEAISRGAFLPGGELRCTTCHERRSPWRFKLAIPPGARVRPAVNPRDPATYDPAAAAPAAPRAGDAVGTKPLCLLCHALD
jgi:hypothetical protein